MPQGSTPRRILAATGLQRSSAIASTSVRLEHHGPRLSCRGHSVAGGAHAQPQRIGAQRL